jgi:hypothetical protein
MKKYAVIIGLGLSTLIWASGAMADHPTKYHKESQRHYTSNLVYEGEHLRQVGHQEIRRGQELMRMGYKEKGQMLIHRGNEDIRAGNRMIREGKNQRHYYSREHINRY